jgi:succinate-semialdehyde dehydrogenase/glutarate-semialdehyde dehydrogenase
MRENGKPEVEALAAEVVTSLDILRFYVRNAERALGSEHTGSASLALWRKRVEISREAFGVVAVVSPWNYPFMLPAGIVAPALIAGNAVVLKPSELTPSTAELLREIFVSSGVPRDVLQIVQGDGATGSALVNADVDKVFFTGSVTTGRLVAHACAERLVPCVLELGGSDPALVLKDADIEHAASGILWGRFANCGQTCVAPKRVIVAREIHDQFVAALKSRVDGLRLVPGSEISPNEYDLGALIRPTQRASLDALLGDATMRGAQRTSVPSAQTLGDGWFPPTLLTGVSADARVLQEESFGPLLPIVSVESEEEMIALANRSEFGLSASIWSRDRERARTLARRLEAGTVVINDVSLIAGVAEVPHGGVKKSGTGRAHGIAGLEECVRTKTIVDDISASWRQPWWFGYGARSYERMDGYTRLAHGSTIRERLSGIASTLALLFKPDRPL